MIECSEIVYPELILITKKILEKKEKSIIPQLASVLFRISTSVLVQ